MRRASGTCQLTALCVSMDDAVHQAVCLCMLPKQTHKSLFLSTV